MATQRAWASCISLVLLLIFLFIPIQAAEQWRSALYPIDWHPDMRDEAGRFLHDFSYAGYHAGERPLPHAPLESAENVIDVTEAPYHADKTGQTSATQAIQQAIDDVARLGGGIVYVPAGTYRITFPDETSPAALHIDASHVILHGEDVDKTFFLLDETRTRQRALLRFGPKTNTNWYNAMPNSKQPIIEDITEPTQTIPVADVSQFHVGQWIALTHETTEAWVQEHNMTALWPSHAVAGQLFFRYITDIDSENDLLIIDAPTRYSLKTRDNASVHLVQPPLEEIGAAHFSIGMIANPKSGWDTADHSVPGTGAYDVHASRGIVVRGVVNSWLSDIASFRPKQNEDIHLHSIGLELTHSRHVTIRRVTMQNPQYMGGGGNGYPFVISGQDNLFHNVQGIDGRHPITISGAQANGNVVLGGYVRSRTSLSSDFHAFLSVANLIDNITVDEDVFEAGDRSHASGVGGLSHGLSTSESVFWNVEGLAYKSNHNSRGDVIIWSEQAGWGYVIGTRGPASKVGLGTGIRTRPVDYLEGEGKGGTLEPASLYIDQLQRRLEREGKNDVWHDVKKQLHIE